MTRHTNAILETMPFIFSAIMAGTSFLQYEIVRAMVERVLRDYHPVTIDDELRMGIAHYVVDIYARITFVLGLTSVLIGALTIGLLKDSRLFLIVAALAFIIGILITFAWFIREPIGKFTRGRWLKRRVNWLHCGLVLANAVLIAMVFFLM